ncbi:MAG: tetraacyldisaccharide 4'-kinase [Alphaproteobacteria bacterium]|nr:tetraacyldisaccharide 4'-kinase [Alphaproteobacteria bacterium]
MRTAPAFWARPAGVLADFLLPIGAMWDTAGRVRQALSRPYCPPVPVICVGNLVAGGAGKTPVAAALASHLAAQGADVHVVARGYGGRLAGPSRVDPARHDAAAVGDEALLHAACVPCWVARDRAAGARAAVAAGADLILLDDGFQNPAVAKTRSLIVVDAAYRFGNGRIIPGGPLREGLARGLARADALVLLETQPETNPADIVKIGRGLPVFVGVLAPLAGRRFAGSRLLAFAGIGRPEKFFAMLRDLGAVLVGTRAFPDHYPFRAAQIAQLHRDAERGRARLVTTAKDILRVPPEMRAGIEVLEIEICWVDPAALHEFLRPLVISALGNGRSSANPDP